MTIELEEKFAGIMKNHMDTYTEQVCAAFFLELDPELSELEKHVLIQRTKKRLRTRCIDELDHIIQRIKDNKNSIKIVKENQND